MKLCVRKVKNVQVLHLDEKEEEIKLKVIYNLDKRDNVSRICGWYFHNAVTVCIV